MGSHTRICARTTYSTPESSDTDQDTPADNSPPLASPTLANGVITTPVSSVQELARRTAKCCGQKFAVTYESRPIAWPEYLARDFREVVSPYVYFFACVFLSTCNHVHISTPRIHA